MIRNAHYFSGVRTHCINLYMSSGFYKVCQIVVSMLDWSSYYNPEVLSLIGLSLSWLGWNVHKHDIMF